MAQVDWDKIAEKLGDDLELDLGDDVKLKGSDLKQFFTGTKGEMSRRDAEIAARDQELNSLRKYQQDTSALFGQAAQLASQERAQPTQPTGAAAHLTPSDRFEEEYGNDPLFGAFAKRYDEHSRKRVEEEILKPFIENQLAPELKRRDDTINVVTRLLLDERQRREFREAGEWPEGTDLEAARKFGTERRYLVPGAEQFGLVDFRRVNDELMTPIRHQKALEAARQEGAEEAATRLRAGTNIIQMPNRTGGGGPKGPTRRGGSAADDVIGNALNEAAQDRETLKLLSAIQK